MILQCINDITNQRDMNKKEEIEKDDLVQSKMTNNDILLNDDKY